MLRSTTAGESHGKAVVALLEGLPHGVPVDEAFINAELKRRQGGYGRGGRMRIESDEVEFLSGVRAGKTLGSPLTMVVYNRDERLEKAPKVTRVRPGHVDLAGALKYGLNDARDVLERASARETAGRVMAGSLCSLFLREFGVHVFAYVSSLGGIQAPATSLSLAELEGLRELRDASDFYTIEPSSDAEMKTAVDAAKEAGDTLGGVVNVAVLGLPPGLGNHTQWDRKLDGKLAQACMSVQAIKAVEIGLGCEAGSLPGSQVHDPVEPEASENPNNPSGFSRARNNAGGLEAGVTNGEILNLRATMKPISTLMTPLDTVDLETRERVKASTERSDTCALPAASVVLQHAVAIVLAEAMLEKFGGDSLAETKRNFEAYIEGLKR